MAIKSLYRLDETTLTTAVDSVNWNNGSYTGCTSVNGKVWKAINIPSGSNEINISSVITQNLSGSAFEINFLTKKTWAFWANQWYIYCNSATSQNLYLYNTSATNIRYAYQHSSWWAQTNIDYTHWMSTDKWYMLTYRGSWTTGELAIDWVVKSTGTFASTVWAFTSNNYMRISLSWQALQGTLDQFSFSNSLSSSAWLKNKYLFYNGFL